MKRIVVGALLSAVALFVWGFLYWNVFPFQAQVFQRVPDEPALAAQLSSALPESGVYFIPSPAPGEAMEPVLQRFTAGPIAQMIFLREGAAPVSPGKFLAGFLHMLVSALLMGALLAMAVGVLGSYGSRVTFVLLAGLAGAFRAHLGTPIWQHHPWDLQLLYFFYDVIAWLLAGLILARFVRPEARTE